MITELRQAVAFTIVCMLLFGGGYHAVLWGIGRVLVPARADGSLVRRTDGTIAGSRLIGQPFTRAEYLHPRPSAVDYDAASTGGSNDGPSNPEHLATVRNRLNRVITLEGARVSGVPSELVTASGSGLDPDIPPAAADLQAPRIAAARGVALDQVRAVIRAHTDPPLLGFVGRARVNVLETNLALDASLGTVRPPTNEAGGR